MRELVVVVSDLYLSPEAAGRPLAAGVALPGLQQLSRFASRSHVKDGWRAWLARWLGDGVRVNRTAGAGAARAGEAAAATVALGADVGTGQTAAPATVAALGVRQGSPLSPAAPSRPPAAPAPTASHVWMATPVHLVAGLSSVHLDVRGVLRLLPDDQAALAVDFQRVFHDSGFALEPLGSGDFLLFGPQMRVGEGAEPARFLGENVAAARKDNSSDPALRRVSAEVEMWLHEHPVNEARRRRGQPPVTGLWLWGGGPAPAAQPMVASEQRADIAFGDDAYLRGLWVSVGGKVLPMPQQLMDVFGYPDAQRAVLLIEIGPMLHSAPTWTFIDALAQIDRAFVHPAVKALQAGQIERLVFVANNRQLTLGRWDHLKVWRQTPTGLAGLQ